MPLETAETGSIGSGSDRDDHVSRRRGVGHACCLEVCKTSRLFRKENEHTACAVPAGTNFLRSGKFQKDLILLELAVIAASCFEVCKTSRFSAKRTACHFLHCAKSNIKSTRDSVLRPRFKALPEKILAEFSGNTSRTRFFAQNGGEKALNRCEVQVLLRKDLERTSKEQPYSLRTVGYGWVGICGVCGGKGLLLRVIWNGLYRQKAFCLWKRRF